MVVWAEQKLGKMLKKGQEKGTLATKGRPEKCVESEHLTTLDEIGISRKQSARAKRLADIPERTIEKHIEAETAAGRLDGSRKEPAEKAKGGRPLKTGSKSEPVSTLTDLGITKKQSHRAQRLADVPERTIERHIIAAVARARARARRSNQE